MMILLIIGLICLAVSYPAMKVLEKLGSRWSNLAMALLIFVGIICIGIFAALE